MGKLQEFEITFDKNKVVYSPGDSITGTVTVKVNQPLPCKGESPPGLILFQVLDSPGLRTGLSPNKEVTNQSVTISVTLFKVHIRSRSDSVRAYINAMN